MSSKNQIFIDGRTAVHTGSKGRVDAWQMYRQGNTVTPRLNVSKTADAVSTSNQVTFFDCPAITTAARIAKSQGDADTEGGLLNGGLKGAATFFKTGSSQLLIEGHEAVRAFDLCEPNRGNGPLMPLMQPGGVPLGNTVSPIALSDLDNDIAEEIESINLSFEACEPDNRYGYAAVLSEDICVMQPVPIDRNPITLSFALPASIDVGTEVTVWLLETDKIPAYTQKNRQAWPVLAKNWASYYPVPLTFKPIKTQRKPKEGKKDNAIVDVACLSVYPVSQLQETLPSGWLYLFMDGYLWREFKITSTSMGIPLYHFSEVNLITQQGRHRREASTQGRMNTILLPTAIQGQAVSMQVAFSETQWPWARIVSAGGMHPAYPRALEPSHQASGVPFLQSEKPHLQAITGYPMAKLHTAPDAPYPRYEGPILAVSV
jgi:hypothetical protein